MPTSQTTFWTLLNEYGVRIPIIQRDYAQGRDDNPTAVIRSKFVHSLHQTLLANDPTRPLDLDFVYGEVKHRDDARLRYLIPLDGQQRLTTLYLLHWYLALAENRLVEAGPTLARFTYQTRSSSREFCTCLTLCNPADVALGSGIVLSVQLRDLVWFQPAWLRDPTVRAMLTMLDALAEKFGQPTDWFDRLTNPANPLVSFQFLELDNVGLTDDLYLKMNARGKALTEFENWKAEFDQFLLRHHPTRQAEFAQRVDGAWTDLFWQHQPQSGPPSPASTDAAFKRFLDYLTTMLALRPSAGNKNPTPEPDDAVADPFARYRRIYADAANVQFLFAALNLFGQAGTRETDDFFSRLFASTQTPGRVTLFDGGGLNLFARVATDPDSNPDIRVRVLLFAVLHQGIKVGKLDPSDPNLHDLVRVIRNQMEKTRQLKDIRYGLILREADIPNLLADIEALVPTTGSKTSCTVYEQLTASPPVPRFKGPRYAHEVEKASLIIASSSAKAAIQQLEDLSAFRGALHNLELDANPARTKKLATAATAIWSGEVAQEDIIRAWLTCGDYTLETSWSGLGMKHFFGNAENWYTVLTAANCDLLSLFLRTYSKATGNTAAERLQNMTNEWLAQSPQRDWRYYFIRYPQMSAASTGQYAWESEYCVRLLSSSSLRAWHINPYVRTVIQLVNDDDKCSEEASRRNDATAWPLYCWIPCLGGEMETVSLYCEDDGWRIELPDDFALTEELAKRYRLKDPKNPSVLKETAAKDRVQIAVAFINHLHESGLVAEYSTPRFFQATIF